MSHGQCAPARPKIPHQGILDVVETHLSQTYGILIALQAVEDFSDIRDREEALSCLHAVLLEMHKGMSRVLSDYIDLKHKEGQRDGRDSA